MPIPRAAITIPFRDLFEFVFRVLVPGGRERERRHVRTFGRVFSARYGDREAVVCCKARMAFYHLLQTMGLKEGAEVIISAIHVADFVNIIFLAGFKPVIVDIEPHGFAIDGEDLKRKISPRTGLILVTHLSGYATDMAAVCAIAGEHGVPVVEDCSQAFNTNLSRSRPSTAASSSRLTGTWRPDCGRASTRFLRPTGCSWRLRR
jgi:dTDP-4-amino-4,6-dideoxygalactose transaminase